MRVARSLVPMLVLLVALPLSAQQLEIHHHIARGLIANVRQLGHHRKYGRRCPSIAVQSNNIPGSGLNAQKRACLR